MFYSNFLTLTDHYMVPSGRGYEDPNAMTWRLLWYIYYLDG